MDSYENRFIRNQIQSNQIIIVKNYQLISFNQMTILVYINGTMNTI